MRYRTFVRCAVHVPTPRGPGRTSGREQFDLTRREHYRSRREYKNKAYRIAYRRGLSYWRFSYSFMVEVQHLTSSITSFSLTSPGRVTAVAVGGKTQIVGEAAV